MNPLISVVVPVYGVEEYLSKCVDSILNQTYPYFELLLVDDGSPDKCPQMCDEYAEKDARIRVIHKKNGGLSDARNAGIDQAKGEYITFIDSDDYVEDIYLELLLKNLMEADADISCGKQRVVYADRTINAYTGKRYVLSSKEAFDMLLYHEDMDVSAWAKLYKTTLFEKIRYPVGRLYEDAATTYLLIDKAETIVLDSQPIYNYMIREKSITNESFSKKKLDLIISTKEMTDFIRKKYPDLSRGCDRRLMFAYLSTLSQTTKSKNVDKSVIKSLTSYIKENSSTVLRDKRTPKRDVIGIICVNMGYRFYTLSWNLYTKLRG